MASSRNFASQAGGTPNPEKDEGGRPPVEQEKVPFEDLVDYLTGKIRSEE